MRQPFTWNLTPEQLKAFREACKRKRILELGGADGWLAEVAMDTARSVLNVDKDVSPGAVDTAGVSHQKATFQEFYEMLGKLHEVPKLAQMLLHPPGNLYDLCLISWPVNYDDACLYMRNLSRLCSSVLYLGKNDGVTQCGTPVLWRELTQRIPLVYAPHRINDMIFYGGYGRDLTQFPLFEEEQKGLNP